MARLDFTIKQRESDPLYFDWFHTPGRAECEKVLKWFDDQGRKPFISQHSPIGSTEHAGHGFHDRPDLAILFKLTFL